MKYTVFFDQVNRTNYQVKANSKEEAIAKASRLYQRLNIPPLDDIQEGWLVETDGEDK